MRVTMDGKWRRVTLDGVEQSKVLSADDAEGWVERQTGQWGQDGRFVSERVYGRVAITLIEDEQPNASTGVPAVYDYAAIAARMRKPSSAGEITTSSTPIMADGRGGMLANGVNALEGRTTGVAARTAAEEWLVNGTPLTVMDVKSKPQVLEGMWTKKQVLELAARYARQIARDALKELGMTWFVSSIGLRGFASERLDAALEKAAVAAGLPRPERPGQPPATKAEPAASSERVTLGLRVDRGELNRIMVEAEEEIRRLGEPT